MKKNILFVLLLCTAAYTAWTAEIPDEFKIKREQVFTFKEKPSVTRKGDSITITFETEGFCDCTIAIENKEGKIIRHLASGVLGKNAPLPFQKNSKKQAIVWDGKNDQERYVDDKDSVVVRVSLGLKPRFERNLYWSPHKRFGSMPLLAAAPEGVYVFDGKGVDFLRLFDHDGNYIRSVYPFPRKHLKSIAYWLAWVVNTVDVSVLLLGLTSNSVTDISEQIGLNLL